MQRREKQEKEGAGVVEKERKTRDLKSRKKVKAVKSRKNKMQEGKDL